MWIDDPLVRVRPLTPDRYASLHELEARAGRHGMWRFPSGMPALEQYVPTLWANVAGQCVLCRRSGRLVGMVMVYDVDLRSGVAWVAVAAEDDVRGGGAALVGLGQVITDLFRNWRLRRVCFEVLSPNVANFRGVRRYATEYGRLRGDRLVDGQLVDLVVLGIDREVWRREAEDRLLKRRPDRRRSESAHRSADLIGDERVLSSTRSDRSGPPEPSGVAPVPGRRRRWGRLGSIRSGT